MGFFRRELLDWVSIFLLQGIFLPQGSNLCLVHRGWILYPINHLGSPVTASVSTHSVAFRSLSLLVRRLGTVPCTLVEILESVCKAPGEFLGGVCGSLVRLSNSLRLHGLQPTRLLCSWNFPGKNTGVGCHYCPPGGLPNPGIKPVSSALAGRFFTTGPPGKPSLVGRWWENCQHTTSVVSVSAELRVYKLRAYVTIWGDVRGATTLRVHTQGSTILISVLKLSGFFFKLPLLGLPSWSSG